MIIQRAIPLNSIKVEDRESEVFARYVKQDDIVYSLNDGQLILKFHLVSSYGGILEGCIPDKRNSISWREVALLTYEFSEKSFLENIKHQIRLLEELLVLLTNADNCLDWATLFLDGNKKCTLYSERYHRNTIKIIPMRECLISFEQVKSDFGNLFSALKSKKEKFGLGVNLYFANRKNNGSYLEYRFLSVVSGMESFFKSKYPEFQAAKKVEKTKRAERVKTQIDFEEIRLKITRKDDKNWFENKLNPHDKFNLFEILYELFKTLPINFNDEKLGIFTKYCEDYRNNFAHADNTGYTQGDDFFNDLNSRIIPLLYLYHFLILQEIGVDKEILQKSFCRFSRRYYIDDFMLLNK